LNEDYRCLSDNSFYYYILIQVLMMLYGTIHLIYDHKRETLDEKLIGAIHITGAASYLFVLLILTNIHIVTSSLINVAYFVIVFVTIS